MVMINHESLPALWNFPAEVTHAVLQVEKGPVGLAGDPVYSCPAFVGNARLTLTAETVPSIGIGWKAVLWQPLLTHAAALIAVLIARPGRVRPLNGVQLNPTPHLIVMSTTKWYGGEAFGFPAAVGFSHARRFTGVILHAADLLVKWFERSVFPPITVVRIAERPPRTVMSRLACTNTAAFVRGCATRPIPDRNPDGPHLAAVLPLPKMRLTHRLWLDNLHGPSALLRGHVSRSHTKVFHALTLCGGTDKCWRNDQIPPPPGAVQIQAWTKLSPSSQPGGSPRLFDKGGPRPAESCQAT